MTRRRGTDWEGRAFGPGTIDNSLNRYDRKRGRLERARERTDRNRRRRVLETKQGVIEAIVLSATRGMSRAERADFKRMRRASGTLRFKACGSIADRASKLRAHFIAAQLDRSRTPLSDAELAWLRSADEQLERIATPFVLPRDTKIDYINQQGERR